MATRRQPASSSAQLNSSMAAGGGRDAGAGAQDARHAAGLCPEKALLGHCVRSTVPAQFWGTPVPSSWALDGVLPSGIADPAPLPLLSGGSGMSRPHLVLATQALKLPGRPSAPGLPSVCVGQGGAVLDRVLAHASGDAWWAVLTGRARLGRFAAQRDDLLAAAADPTNYGLCANTRVQLRRNAVLRTRVDWTPPAPAPLSGSRRPSSAAALGSPAVNGDAPASASAGDAASCGGSSGCGSCWATPVAVSSQLRSRVGTSTEIRADLAVNQRLAAAAAGSSGQGWAQRRGGQASAGATPLLVGVQAGTAVGSKTPLVWRAGLLQVTAPATVPLGAAAGGGGPPAQLQSALYAQGTVALQGERILWRAPRHPPRRRSRQPGGAPSAGPRTPAASAAGGGGGGEGAAHTATAAPAPSLGPHNPLRRALTKLLPIPASVEDDDSRGGRGGASGAASDEAPPPPFGVELPTAGVVQEALLDVTQSISRLRDDVTTATQWVAGGGLVESLEAAGGGCGAEQRQRRQRQQPARRGPWSAFVDVPHVRVAGVAGFTARSPLAAVAHGGAAAAAAAAAAGGHAEEEESRAGTGSALPARLAWAQDFGLTRLWRRAYAAVRGEGGGAAAGGGSGAGWGGVGLGGSGPAGSAALRPFASAAVGAQAGRFNGWVLDYTRVACQLDCGLWGPAGMGAESAAPPPRQRHPAFALGDTGGWHAVTVSLSQQLLGPLRAVADWRFELASGAPLALPPLRPPPPPADSAFGAPADGGAAGGVAGAAAWLPGACQGVAAHVGGMRPSLVDAVYGVDLALPGSQGAARLVAWYAPRRREGMLEVRLF